MYRRPQSDGLPASTGGNNFVWQVVIGTRIGVLGGAVYGFFLRLGYVAADLNIGRNSPAPPWTVVLQQDLRQVRIRSMKTAYVVRELVSLPAGENEFLTHYEYGTFRTYNEANECAIATKNPRCFPQREHFPVSRREEALVH